MLTDHFKRLLGLISPKRFEISLIVIISLSFFISLVAANSIRPYTSDDVGVQTIVQNWESGESRNAVLGTDNYIIRIPFYAIEDHVIKTDSRDKIFITVLFLNAILLIGLLFLARSMLSENIKKSRLNLALFYLPICWFLALSVLPILSFSQVSRVTTYMCTNFRNAELGIAFILIGLVSKYIGWANKKMLSRRVLGLSLGFLFLIIFFYDDPFFVYMLIVPIILGAAILWLSKKLPFSKLIKLTVYMAAAVIGSMVLGPLVRHFGYDSISNVPKQFIGTGQLWHNVFNTIHGELKSFSATFNGRRGIHVIPELLNAVFSLLCLAAILITLINYSKLKPIKIFLSLIIMVDLAVYTLTTTNSLDNDRYLILAVFAEVLLLSTLGEYIRKKSLKYLLVSLYIVGVLVNVAVNTRVIWQQSKPTATKPNSINYTIIQAIEKQGLSKGYASYWYGNIDTYLSQFKIQFLPVVCNNYALEKFDWVVNKPAFNKPAKKTFYLYNVSSDWPTVNSCTSSALSSSMGITPSKVININSEYKLYIYNQDIGQKMEQSSIQ